MKTDRATQGFSLAEMLVVIAILSFTTLVVFNGYASRKDSETVNTIGVKISRLASLASVLAVSSGITTGIIVNLSSQTITVERSQTILEVPSRYKLSVLTGAELTRQNVLATINFYNNGTSSGGEIAIEDSRGSKRTVRILWLTGTIDIVDKVGS